MTVAYLLDEHIPRWWRRALIQQQPSLKALCVGEPGAPPLQSADPVLLEWCETHDFLLVTNNRKSMPGHLADHVARGRHVPGILVMDPALPTAVVVDDLLLIAGASFTNEFRDQIRYLPLAP
jgi:hypothetical protein